MKTILEKYRLPVFGVENEGGAEPEPATEAAAAEDTNAGQPSTEGEAPAQLAEAEAAVAEQDAPEGLTEQEQEDWRDKEIRKKHAQIKQRDERIKAQERQIEDLKALAQRRANGEDVGEQPTQQPLSDDAVTRRAQELRAQERYTEQLTATNAAGEKAFGAKWGAALDRLAQLGTIEPADMTAILNTDAPEKVLYELGSNPAEWQRIEALPPARRLTEFVKLSMKAAPQRKPSAAPAPVNPVSPRATPNAGLRDDLTDEEWHAIRRKEKADRWKERQALGR